MEKIIITIPDNLSPAEEAIAIAKELGKKFLPKTGNKQKALGTGYEIQQLETQIIIKREPVEKAIATKDCSVCGTVFPIKSGVPLWINYGGVQKQRHYCKESCRQTVIDLVGEGRAAISRKGLKNHFITVR